MNPDTARRPIDVAAALIRRDDKFLICQRPAHKARGLLWEFAGGKVEEGESPAGALIRECREELGVTLEVGGLFMELTHSYPDITVHLSLFEATLAQGEPQKLEHADLRWVRAEDLPAYAFCPADAAIIRVIAERFARRGSHI
ncbi:MAG: (deoxy)nucleoside triphosphate pyrophosphohydrolase [Desulfovibrionaceae bacterium]|nr:(deoxy)nucleoside triphosphate pyrophosphohydrolase [Desulfovibrionaceae bacterium]